MDTGMANIEIIDKRFLSCVLPNAPLEKLGEGFRWLEGPVWFADHQCLLVSDIPNNRIMRWTESGGVSVFRQPSRFANGHTRDREGRLIGCSHQDRCITRTELDGRVTVLADRYQGKRLNSPNDIVVKRDSTIWFSDPTFGITRDYEGGKQESESPPNLYRFDPRDGSLTVVADDFDGPNGLCFSPDEKLLYVAESGTPFTQDRKQYIRVFDVSDDGARLRNPRVFHKVEPGMTDGFRCDEDGNIWSSAADGVHCIDPSGELLGKLKVPFVVSNLAFGGRDYSRIFICGSQTLFAQYVNRRGAQRP
ncbi:MAG: SMP-30/gluconolactonase/LRE family protein [Rhodanobacteraceae bacterium]